MIEESPQSVTCRRDFVPFPKVFALFGYAVFSALAVALLFEGLATAYFAVLGTFHRGNSEDRCPCYAGQPWAKEYLAEDQRRKRHIQSSYVPFRIWGAIALHGNQINVDTTALGTVRRTLHPAAAACAGKPVSRIWVFGGSTTFGAGVPDWATMPSFLSAALNTGTERCFDVENFGVEGYVTNQEVLYLTEKLKEGQKPDEVIFYDGINEAFVGGVTPGGAATHLAFDQVQTRIENRLRNRLSFIDESNAMKLVAELGEHFAPSDALVPERVLHARAKRTLDNYLANVRTVRLLANDYHFVSHFFWQPVLYAGKKPLTPYEASAADDTDLPIGPRRRFKAGVAAVYDEAERRAGTSTEFTYLGHLFDSVKESLYIDRWMHLCPHGNEMVAGVLARMVGSDGTALGPHGGAPP